MPRAHSISSSEAAIRNLEEWIEQDRNALAKWPGDERIKESIADKQARIDFHRNNIVALRSRNASKRENDNTRRVRSFARKAEILNKRLTKKLRALEYTMFMMPSNPEYYEAQRITFEMDIKLLREELVGLANECRGRTNTELGQEYGQ